MDRENEESPGQLISTYWIDRDYNLTRVGAAWDQFAIDNGGEELVAPQIIGQNLFSYIASDTTRMYLRVVFDYVWTIKNEVEKPYRCDSPDMKRFMQMQASIDSNELMRVDHFLLRTQENRQPVHVSGVRSQTSNLIERCSMCNRINIALKWMDADMALHQGLLSDSRFRVVYTMCNDCNGR